jgi:hypothetical protein
MDHAFRLTLDFNALDSSSVTVVEKHVHKIPAAAAVVKSLILLVVATEK